MQCNTLLQIKQRKLKKKNKTKQSREEKVISVAQ